MTSGRLVWISDKEFQDWSYAVDVEGENGGYIEKACDPLLQRYRDAPSDPADAAFTAIINLDAYADDEVIANAVLAALGVPVCGGLGTQNTENTP